MKALHIPGGVTMKKHGTPMIGFWLPVLLLQLSLMPGWAKETFETDQGELSIHPIEHASLVMVWNDLTIYVDPVGGEDAYVSYDNPDLVLLTDIHGDHLNVETLQAVITEETQLIAPSAVADQLEGQLKKQTQVMKNGDTQEFMEIKIEAIPMYNLTPDRLKFHEKGRGNGYLLTLGGKRIYLSGDTEDIPEMRALKDIDIAFVCMNLPYTMTVEQAADAVKEFKPKVCYPYHFRDSNVKMFEQLVEEDTEVDVRLLAWYPSSR
jgi:L-ascorbate metabolism protein UlaG (beta-lactamase superfamily)